MSEMIERVALALHEQYAKRCAEHGSTCAPFDGPGADPRYRGNLLDDARAVLTAMREPTEGMVDAAYTNTPGDGAPSPTDAWPAMIDAALT